MERHHHEAKEQSKKGRKWNGKSKRSLNKWLGTQFLTKNTLRYIIRIILPFFLKITYLHTYIHTHISKLFYFKKNKCWWWSESFHSEFPQWALQKNNSRKIVNGNQAINLSALFSSSCIKKRVWHFYSSFHPLTENPLSHLYATVHAIFPVGHNKVKYIIVSQRHSESITPLPCILTHQLPIIILFCFYNLSL